MHELAPKKIPPEYLPKPAFPLSQTNLFNSLILISTQVPCLALHGLQWLKFFI